MLASPALSADRPRKCVPAPDNPLLPTSKQKTGYGCRGEFTGSIQLDTAWGSAVLRALPQRKGRSHEESQTEAATGRTGFGPRRGGCCSPSGNTDALRTQSARSTGAGSGPGARLPTRDGSARGTGNKGHPGSSTGRSCCRAPARLPACCAVGRERQIPAQSPPEGLGPTGALPSRPRPVVRHHSPAGARAPVAYLRRAYTLLLTLGPQDGPPTRARTAHRSPASSLP